MSGLVCWWCGSALLVRSIAYADGHDDGGVVCGLCGRPQLSPAWLPLDRREPEFRLKRLYKAHRGLETKVAQ